MIQEPPQERIILGEIAQGNLRNTWKWLKSIRAEFMRHFEDDGTLIFKDEATVWNDVNIPGTAFRSVGAAALGAFTLPGTGLTVTTFNGTGGLVAAGQSSFEIMHGYKHGTDIQAHVHWCPTTSAAGNVKWQLEYAWINRGGTISASTIVSAVSPSGGVVGQEHRTGFPLLPGAGKEIGGRFQFRIFRDPSDAADTYTADVGLLDFGFHFQQDTVGSREMVNK